MSPARVDRRLAAILATDVAGYSRLIGADEEGMLAALKAIRAELTDPKIAEHRGRIVKTTGDGLLVEFASVVDALRCATEWQRGMANLKASVPPDARIEFRIGIHQGDIVVEDGDIFGDGVNVAARLEALAEPGGICVSARVQEDAAGRAPRGASFSIPTTGRSLSSCPKPPDQQSAAAGTVERQPSVHESLTSTENPSSESALRKTSATSLGWCPSQPPQTINALPFTKTSSQCL
jgi:hypothetical protein